MAQCKTMHRCAASLGSTATGKELVCSAFVGYVLGVGSLKADLSVRLSLHAKLVKGCGAFYDRVVELSKHADDPIVFTAVREYIVLSARDDLSLATYLEKTCKWSAFAANVLNTADMLRARLRDRSADGDFFDYKIFCNNADEKNALVRQCKKVPGLFSRAASKKVPLQDCCKLLKRFRDKRLGNNGLNTDAFCNEWNIAVLGMSRMAGLPVTARVPLDVITTALHKGGPASQRAFVDFVDGMALGTESLIAAAKVHVGTESCALSDAFMISLDCLELINHCSSFFKIDLPTAYGDRQREAVCRRFKDTNLTKDEMYARAATLVWCGGCKTIKNFVLSGAKKDANNHLAHGYKRVSQGPKGVMCYEKKRFHCCRAVPVRQVSLLSADMSTCVSIFGSVYAISTCCGWLAQLNHLTARESEPLCCSQCALAQVSTTETAEAAEARVCHYCNMEVLGTKGSFTGLFQHGEGPSEHLTFCKRHTKHCMRHELEPINLEECIRQLGKKFKR
jgi:hypothetical protein